MEYYEMTTEDAIEFLNKYQGRIVLIAVKNLEDDNNAAFAPMQKVECESMIREAETIASACDDFAEQLRLFSHRQNIFNIVPKGVQKTLLFGKGAVKND